MKRPFRILIGFLALAVVQVSCSPQAAPVSSAAGGPGVSSPEVATDVSPAGSVTGETAPAPTGLPQPSATPDPSPTPIPAARQLTQGGCCTGPFWAPDSSAVFYLDRPSPNDPAGIWRVDRQGGAPALHTDRLGVYSEDWAYRAFPEGDVAVVERMADGARWTHANGGRAVAFAPGSQRLAWTAGQSGPPFDSALREIWVSNVDGTDARQVYQGLSAGLAGWLSGESLLISGRAAPGETAIRLWRLSLETGAVEEVLQSPGLRGSILSPERRWLAYQVVFSGQAEQDGLWIADLESGERRRLDLFGAYQWRPGGKLLVIPLEPGASAHRLIEVDAATGAARPLTNPATTPFRIANGDWAVSPDGRSVAFLSAADHNIWVLDLPE